MTRKDVEGREWGGNQKITVDEALRIATINGARASYEEQIKGSITAGKLADFVMLERDPHDEDPDQIKHIGVVRTVVGGRTTVSDELGSHAVARHFGAKILPVAINNPRGSSYQ